MDPFYWVLLVGLVILAFVLGGTIAWFFIQRRNERRLRGRFGPEYDRLVEKTGDRYHAEHELLQREQRVKQFDIHPLSSEQRSHYAEAWLNVQASFVDAPVRAVVEADDLVTDAMRARGYPMTDFEQRADDLSVTHPHVVENYRAGHALAGRSERGEASTEDLRQAMVHYRALFENLLESPVTDGQTRQTRNSEVKQ